MSAVDDYTIALNILSRVGLDGDLISEFGKAKAITHQIKTYNELQPLPMTPQSTISGQPDQSTAQPQNPQITPQNEGNGTLNLPQ
jgi:hypothetical protein